MTKTIWRAACAAAALALAGLLASVPAGAAPVSGGVRLLAKAEGPAIKVHRRGRRHHHGYGRDVEVDAPTTYVESGRHVVVEAPFTSVYVGRHGRHIRAPFVDLWIPR